MTEDPKDDSAFAVADNDRTWRRRGKVYILLHAIAVAGVCFLVFAEVYFDLHSVPKVPCLAAKTVAELGVIPFLLSSPIVAGIMLFGLSSRHREWLYLGMCEAALLVLHVVAIIAVCTM